MDAGRAPFYEVDVFALADSLEGFVHLGGVDFALDDVEDRDVAVLAGEEGSTDIDKNIQSALKKRLIFFARLFFSTIAS